MDLLLVFVVLASLGLAAFMSVVAWKLLRDNRERSAARVAALETLAGEEVADVARFHEEGDAPEPPLEEPGDELYPREVAYDGDDLDGDFGHAPDASDDSMDDEIDRANFDSDRDLALSLSDNERETLLQIEDALRRISSGVFGSCTSCSKPIGDLRLDAIPWARYCIDCQELEEKGLLG